MKKNRQFTSKTETANEMNIENDIIRDNYLESTAFHAYAHFTIKTRILSTKELVSVVQTKAFQARFESKSFEIRKSHKKLRKVFRLVIKETEDSVSRKAIENIAQKNINFVNSLIELRIV
jgi:hypothetical protein